MAPWNCSVRSPGIQIELDAVTGAPAWIRSSIGFLASPGGDNDDIPGIPSPAGQRVGGPDRHRPIKWFLEENASLFGHGAGVLDSARISREFVTEHNGMRTIVWEQQLDGIPTFEGLMVGHLSRNGELVSLSSRLLPDAGTAADTGTPNRQFRASVSGGRGATGQSPTRPPTLVRPSMRRWKLLDLSPKARRTARSSERPDFSGTLRSKWLWLPMGRSTLRLCWRVIVTGQKRNEMFQVLVDTQTGNVMVRNSWTFRAQPATFPRLWRRQSVAFLTGWSTPNTKSTSLRIAKQISLWRLSPPTLRRTGG